MSMASDALQHFKHMGVADLIRDVKKHLRPMFYFDFFDVIKQINYIACSFLIDIKTI